MHESKRIAVGDWLLLPSRNLLERDGQSVRLKPRAMDVLVYLASHAGDVVSTDELINSVWQGRVVGDGTVYQSINQLRQALGDGVEHSGYIETIARRGYRLTAAVVTAENPRPEDRRSRIQSLVVLPFTNLSSDPEQEYFTDGMTEVLIANLARLRALRIISRTSAMCYKGSNRSLPEIAAQLGVDAVVEGSVLRAGQKVRITVQLVHGATGKHLWAESYERDVEDVLLLQSEVAQAVTREIQVVVTPEERKNLASARRVNPQANEAFLKGRFHYWKVSPEHLDKALEYYNLVLELDPQYALAYASIGDVWSARGCLGFVLPHEALAIGRPATIKSIELDDQLADGHEMMARFKFFYEWDWAATESESLQAIALNPNNPDVGFAYWHLLMVTRRFEAATKQAEHVLNLDPFNPTYQWFLGSLLLFEGRYDDAISQFEKLLDTQPAMPWAYLGLCSGLHRKGRTEQALPAARQFLVLIGHGEAAAAMEHGYAESGYQAAMCRGAENLAEKSKSGYVQALLIARFFAHAGEKLQALDWQDRAFQLREPFLVQLNVDVDWDGRRAEPRFSKLLKKIGLQA